MRRPHLGGSSTRQSQSGFTLIELLLAVLIFSFLGAVLFATFSQGVRVWHAARSQDPASDIHLFMSKLTRELRNSFDYYREPFRGDPSGMSFTAVLPVQNQKIQIFHQVHRSLGD